MNKQDKINRILTNIDSLSKAYEMAEALGRVDNDRDFYLLAKAIAPDSISIRWKREAILDAVEDVLLSRA